MRLEKYQVKRTEEYEGGRQKITETRYRILNNEGKLIDHAQGTATNSPRRRESPTIRAMAEIRSAKAVAARLHRMEERKEV